MTSTERHIVVVGAGAAGMMAAAAALSAGARVTLFDRNDRPGKKLRITGKGRCNLTNACTVPELVENVVHNPRFLYTAFSRFSPADVCAFFEETGVPLKTERGRRVFPVSDRAQDVVDALSARCAGAQMRHDHVRRLLLRDGRAVGVAGTAEVAADAVILACGGVSYPATGSDGSGFALAREAGHTVTPLFPSLVPLVSPDGCCAEMQGLSLRNVGLTIEDGNGRVLYRDFGEMLFTHFGLSGPMILSASSRLHEADIAKTTAVIDLKPALDTETLRARLQADFTKYANRIYGNALCDLLPSGMIPVFVRKSGVPGEKKVHQLTKEDRQRVLALLKRFPVPLSGYRPMAEAIVTCGGVNVREVDPKTMQSRLCPGLYFAGEMLDVDAYTGGYNLQIAFSTGHLAGESAALAE